MGLVTANQFRLTPDLVGATSRGMSLGDQFRQRALQSEQDKFLQGNLQSPDTLQNAAKLGLGFQKEVANGLNIIDERTGKIDQKMLNEAANFAFSAQDLPEAQQNIAIQKRVEKLQSEGRDASQTNELLTIPFKDRGRIFQSVQLAGLPNAERLDFIQSGGNSKIQFGSQKQFKDDAGNVFFATLRNDPSTGESTPNVVPLIEGTQVSGKLSPMAATGLTAPEDVVKKRQIALDKAEIKHQSAAGIKFAGKVGELAGKGSEDRRQAIITAGFEAGPRLADIDRGIELLKTIKTGGVAKAINEIQIFTGSQSGDALELQNILENAVLGQLRDTFGAQFTEKETRLLIDINANFGKSTAGNIRLLTRSQKLMEERVKNGIAANRRGPQTDINKPDFTGRDPNDKGVIQEDAQGNRARVFKDGSFEEL